MRSSNWLSRSNFTKKQMRHGRYFVHEHPAYATSWREEVIKNLLEEQGVVRATCDQCLYGCESEAKDPVKKPTTFMTKAPGVARELQQRCQGRGGACSRPQGGRHAQCRGKTARMAAVYHLKLCRAISVGFRNQLWKRSLQRRFHRHARVGDGETGGASGFALFPPHE